MEERRKLSYRKIAEPQFDLRADVVNDKCTLSDVNMR